jgi:hypothetical protein
MDHLVAQIWKTLTMKSPKRRVPFSLPLFATAHGTTKGLSQIVTPDLQAEGDLSLSLQIQDKRIANPYELQAELSAFSSNLVRGFSGDCGHRQSKVTGLLLL